MGLQVTHPIRAVLRRAGGVPLGGDLRPCHNLITGIPTLGMGRNLNWTDRITATERFVSHVPEHQATSSSRPHTD